MATLMKGREMESKIITQRVVITPAKAAEWLGKNTGNFRTLDKSRVRNYAEEMRSGNWELNGETIKFNGDLLLDGQHRLAACIESGVPFQSLVVTGLASSATHIDRGRPRTIGQWLAHQKIKNANNIAAVSRLCIAHDKGLWDSIAWGVSAMTDSEVISFAEQHHEGINASFAFSRLDKIPSSLICAVVFIGSGKRDATKNEMAKWFVDALTTGSNLSETDAVFHLRNRMLQQRSSSERITRFMLRMLLTLAWNKTVQGVSCGPNSLRLRMSGPGKQAMPAKILLAGEDSLTDVE